MSGAQSLGHAVPSPAVRASCLRMLRGVPVRNPAKDILARGGDPLHAVFTLLDSHGVEMAGSGPVTVRAHRIQWDSPEGMFICMQLGDAFAIEIADDQLRATVTFGDLVDLVTGASMADRVVAIIAAVLDLPAHTLQPYHSLHGLGADSLDRLELILDLDAAFAIEITDAEGEAAVTVGDVIDLVAAKVAAKAASTGARAHG